MVNENRTENKSYETDDLDFVCFIIYIFVFSVVNGIIFIIIIADLYKFTFSFVWCK